MKERNSSIELLRILAILIIISHHFSVHGVFHVLEKVPPMLIVDNLSWQIIFTQIISGIGGLLGNSIFILITGYFTITKGLNAKRIILLLMTMFIYSWAIEIFYFYCLSMPYTLRSIIEETLPILFGKNWFVSCYIIFSLFIPFINKFLKGLSEKQYLIFVALLFVFYVILPAFKVPTFMNAMFIFFGLLYAIGGYLKLYGRRYIKTMYNRKYLKITLVHLVAIIGFIIFFDGMAVLFDKDILLKRAELFNNILSITMAVSLFLYFLTIKPFHSKIINAISGTVLGVYLIHDNKLMRIYIWDYIFPNKEYIVSDYYVLFFVIKVLAVFIACSSIEYFRKKYLEAIFVKFLDKYWDKWCSRLKQCIDLYIAKLID